MELLNAYRDKKILIWGYGKEGKSTEAFFNRHPVAARVDITEAKPDEIDVTGYDYVFKSPGIRCAESPLREGLDPVMQEKLTSQAELFIRAFRDRVVCITATKGKSTTASLMAHVLKDCFEKQAFIPESKQQPGMDIRRNLKTAYLVGNIGLPCLDFFDEMCEGDAVASFETAGHHFAYSDISPHIGVFINLYEDHLDFYENRDNYFHAKRHITDFQNEDDWLYLGTDVPPLTTRAHVVRVDTLYDTKSMTLLGDHNRYNASFVDHVARERFGLDPDAVRQAIEEFPGLPHRIQLVAEIDGVKYYDDSISTIPASTIQATDSVPNVATVLIGGKDRGIDYTPLIDLILDRKDVQFIGMYATGERVLKEMKDKIPDEINNYQLVEDLVQAVSLAKKITPAGRACVLSPAAASFGYFKNFEERGDRFAELVRR